MRRHLVGGALIVLITLGGAAARASGVYAQQERANALIAVEQDGRTIQPSGGEVRVRRAPFTLVLTMPAGAWVHAHGSESPAASEAARSGKALDPFFADGDALAIDLLNTSQALLLAGEGQPAYHAWFYEAPDDHTFDRVAVQGANRVARFTVATLARPGPALYAIERFPGTEVFVTFRLVGANRAEIGREAVRIVFADAATGPGGATRERALQLSLDGKHAEAIALLEGIVKREPKSAEAHLDLATATEMAAMEIADSEPSSTARRQKLMETAAGHYRQTLDLTTEPYDRLAPLAKLVSLYDADALDRPADAEPFARELVAVRPETPVWHEKLARVLLRLNRPADVARVLLEARGKISADQRDFFVAIATKVLIDDEQFSKTDIRALTEALLADIDAVIEKDPNEREHYLTRGALLQLQLNRLDLDPKQRAALDGVATRNFDRFMALHPDRLSGKMPAAEPAPPADPWKAELDAVQQAVDEGRTADADKALAAATKTHAAEPGFWQDVAELEYRRGNPDQSIAALTRWTELEPENPEIHYALATHSWDRAYRDPKLSEVRKRELATSGLAAADKALALKPDYMEAMVYRGLLLRVLASLETDAARKAKLTAEAEAMSKKALEQQRKRVAEVP